MSIKGANGHCSPSNHINRSFKHLSTFYCFILKRIFLFFAFSFFTFSNKKIKIKNKMEDNTTTENLYEILGIPKSATTEQVKKVRLIIIIIIWLFTANFLGL